MANSAYEKGLAYDSDEARAFTGAVTAIMHGEDTNKDGVCEYYISTSGEKRVKGSELSYYFPGSAYNPITDTWEIQVTDTDAKGTIYLPFTIEVVDGAYAPTTIKFSLAGSTLTTWRTYIYDNLNGWVESNTLTFPELPSNGVNYAIVGIVIVFVIVALIIGMQQPKDTKIGEAVKLSSSSGSAS